MHPLFAELLKKLRSEPLDVVVRKIVTNAAALAGGKVFLRACDSVGARARCFGRPRIANEGHMHIGDDFALGCAFGTASIVTSRHAAVDIGRGVTVNYGTSIRAARHVSLGDRVLVGPFCVIEDADVPGDEAHASSIEIGNDVWLAARVVVRPGARIGAGAVIAAGSVVDGEIPANAIASGAPARVLRIREPHEAAEVEHASVA